MNFVITFGGCALHAKNILVFSHHFWLLSFVENGKVLCMMRAKQATKNIARYEHR